MSEEWSKVDAIAEILAERLGDPPQVALVLGSGLGGAVASLDDSREISFGDVPSWPAPTVEGHDGRLVRGRIGRLEVLFQLGRVHMYEGYSPTAVVRPVRAAIGWGASTVILTNAAGAIGDAARPGDLMMLEDHINLTGRNPLRGPNDDRRGPRFVDMTDIYDSGLRALALDRAAELGIGLRTGVYAGMSGPSYETPAEVRMLATLGADAVGMSTVLEAIAARHLGARLAGVSCITNLAAATGGGPLSHEDVAEIGARATDDMSRLLIALLSAMESGP
ncbi:MAG: purine-nucleoside phosphorylase [Polyangia bacterium]